MKRYILYIFGWVSSVAGKHITYIICYLQAVASNMLCLTENKYHIYNFTAAGNFKLVQLECGLVH